MIPGILCTLAHFGFDGICQQAIAAAYGHGIVSGKVG